MRKIALAVALVLGCGAPDTSEDVSASVETDAGSGDAGSGICRDCGYLGGPCCAGAFCPAGGRPSCDDGFACDATSVCWYK